MKGDKKRKATFFQKGHKYIQSSAVKKSAKYAISDNDNNSSRYRPYIRPKSAEEYELAVKGQDLSKFNNHVLRPRFCVAKQKLEQDASAQNARYL